MIKAGIIGGAGYTAGELIRLLLNHPETEIVFINSSSNAGNRITDVHEGLYGETDLRFTDQLPLDEIDVLFFCTAHGDTKKFMESHNIPEDLKIIDLSMDYRIMSDDHDFIYGLPELNRRATCTAKHVANPGCFATCIQLGLLPLAKNLMLTDDVMVNAITGSTGAGVKPGATSHFSWRNNNMSVYKGVFCIIFLIHTNDFFQRYFGLDYQRREDTTSEIATVWNEVDLRIETILQLFQ